MFLSDKATAVVDPCMCVMFGEWVVGMSVCCAQVSADGEVKLYEACVAAGTTLLSIAHR